MLWSSNNLIITIITLCTIIHEMKTRCGRDEINMWEWIQLEDNLPDDLKKINHSFLARFPILVLIRGLRTLPVRLPVLLGPPGQLFLWFQILSISAQLSTGCRPPSARRSSVSNFQNSKPNKAIKVYIPPILGGIQSKKVKFLKIFEKIIFGSFCCKSVFNILKLLTWATYHGILGVCRDFR